MSSLQLQLEAAQTDITRLKGDVYTLEQSTAVSSAALLQANADKKCAPFCTEFCITQTSDHQPEGQLSQPPSSLVDRHLWNTLSSLLNALKSFMVYKQDASDRCGQFAAGLSLI